MRLVYKATGQEIKQGDVVNSHRHGECHLSGLDQDKRIVFLFQDIGEGNAYPVRPADIQAEFRP